MKNEQLTWFSRLTSFTLLISIVLLIFKTYTFRGQAFFECNNWLNCFSLPLLYHHHLPKYFRQWVNFSYQYGPFGLTCLIVLVFGIAIGHRKNIKLSPVTPILLASIKLLQAVLPWLLTSLLMTIFFDFLLSFIIMGLLCWITTESTGIAAFGEKPPRLLKLRNWILLGFLFLIFQNVIAMAAQHSFEIFGINFGGKIVRTLVYLALIFTFAYLSFIALNLITIKHPTPIFHYLGAILLVTVITQIGIGTLNIGSFFSFTATLIHNLLSIVIALSALIILYGLYAK